MLSQIYSCSGASPSLKSLASKAFFRSSALLSLATPLPLTPTRNFRRALKAKAKSFLLLLFKSSELLLDTVISADRSESGRFSVKALYVSGI